MKLALAEDLKLPLEVVTEKLGWLGRTGSGKTYGAQKAAELMLEAGAQVGAIDPVGVWPALRVPAKAGGQSFEVVVFGGLRGDLPLEPTEAAGVLVADLVCDRRLSFVLDVSQFIPAEQQRVVRAFVDRFYHRKKAAPSAVHIFMEECQEFIPENPQGQEKQTLGVMQRMWKLGRNFGIGGSLISQRPQEVSKKALNMSGTLFVFQMMAPQERKAVRLWVADKGIAVDIEAVLQKLDVGHAHVESPMFLNTSKVIHILPKVTADLSSTPKVTGEARPAATRPLTPIDIKTIREEMAETIARAEAEDPTALRRKNAELVQAVTRARNAEAAAVNALEKLRAKPAKASAPLIAPSDLKRLEAAITRMEKDAERLAVPLANLDGALSSFVSQRDRLAQSQQTVVSEAGNLRTILERGRGPTASSPGLHPGDPGSIPGALANFSDIAPAMSKVVRDAYSEPGSLPDLAPDGVGKGELRVLMAIAQHAGCDREQISVLTGYKKSSRDAYLSRLGRARLIAQGDRGLFYATHEGKKALGPDFKPLPTGKALRDHWLHKLPEGERRVLATVIPVYPHTLSRDSITEATGYKKSSRDAYVSRLQRRKLVTTSRDGVRLSEHLA